MGERLEAERPPRTRLAAGERRELVVAAARRCFGAAGYDGTTIDEIAAAAGVTKPIVYRHFGSKRELYLALLAQHRDDLPTFLEGVELDPGASAEDALRPVFENWFGYVAANSHAWEMLFRDRTGDEEIKAFRLAVSGRATAVLADLVRAAGRVEEEQVEPTAEMLRAGLAGLVLWSIDHPGAEREVLVEVALRMAGSAV